MAAGERIARVVFVFVRREFTVAAVAGHWRWPCRAGRGDASGSIHSLTPGRGMSGLQASSRLTFTFAQRAGVSGGNTLITTGTDAWPPSAVACR